MSILCNKIIKTYKNLNDKDSYILQDLNLELKDGDFNILFGPSGSGKTTLLQILGLTDNFDSGIIEILGKKIEPNFKESDILDIRRQIAYIYQFHNLLPEFSVLENIQIPQMISNMSKKESHQYAMYLIEKMNLQDRIKHRPHQLSGGECQRVAVCRALSIKPKIIIADEPTGNLDQDNAIISMEEIYKATKEFGVTTILATHNENFAKLGDSVFDMKAKQCIKR